jgi:hypothetical protein
LQNNGIINLNDKTAEYDNVRQIVLVPFCIWKQVKVHATTQPCGNQVNSGINSDIANWRN